MKQFTQMLETKTQSIAAWKWWVMALFATVVQQFTMGWLNAKYLATEFPVSIYVGQTVFDADAIKGYYDVLLQKGTFGDYVMVQIYDYGFMATIFLSFALLAIAVYRSLPQVKWLQHVGWAMIFIGPMAAVFDAFENAVSFFMLADPKGFADWWVYPYCSFAVAKFATFSILMFWVLVGSTISLIANLIRLFGFNRQCVKAS